MKITETIKLIKRIVSDPDKADEHDPLMVATTYAGQCEVVNERLKKCAALIQNNMIQQALDEAGYDPHLIDLSHQIGEVAAGWRNLCKAKGWTIPQELNMEALNEIMRSFSMESTIEPLLKQLRRANNQGHLGQCVAILREIAKKNPDNPDWKSNLAEFETAYLERIKEDIDRFRQDKDINGIARLIVEIKQPWSISTESIAVKELATFIEEQYLENLRQEEQETVSRIGISFQSGNVEALGNAITAYENLEKNRYFKPEPSLQIVYANALNWYKQQIKSLEIQKSYEDKIQEIKEKIARSSHNGIKSLWDEVNLYRLPIPEEIVPPVKILIRKEESAKKQRQIKKQMGYILILLFAMVCIGLAATFNYYRQIRNRLTVELESAVVAENLQQCNSVINDMAGRRIAFIETPIFSSSEIETHRAKATSLASLLEQKRAIFEMLINALEHLQSENFPATAEDVEHKINAIEAASNSVTPRDLARLKLVKSAWQERKAIVRAMEEKHLAEIFLQISYQFKNLLPAGTEEEIYTNEQTLIKIGELVAEGGKLANISGEMRKNLDKFKSQMDSTREILSVRKSQLREIIGSSSLDGYIRELKTFAGTFPDDPLTRRIRPIIDMAKLYSHLLSVPKIDDLSDSDPLDGDEPEEESSSSNPDKRGDDNKSGTDQEKPASQQDNDIQNPFWSKTAEMLTAFNKNIMLHSDKVQEELKKMERTARFVDLWECTVNRPNFEPAKWYFNGKPREEFIQGIKSYTGIAYVLSPDDMQPEFKANSAITIQVQNLRKMDHCDVIQKTINNISYNIGIETVMQEIKNIYSQPFSPILKLHIISFLTDQIFTLTGNDNALPFVDMAKDFKRFNRRPTGDQVNWLCSAHNKYGAESRLAQAILSRHLDRPDKMNSQIINWKIRDISLKRIPKWVGFADLKEPEQLHFKTGVRPNEVWVVRGEGIKNGVNSSGANQSTDIPLIFVAEEQRMGETVKYLDHKGYLPGEPLFAPYDNSTTSELLKSIISDMNGGRPPVNSEWPIGWPVNIRR